MASVSTNGIRIEYEAHGNPADEPIILIPGHSCQLTVWGDEVCSQLEKLGFYVIRIDNRDSGRSTLLEDAGTPNLLALMLSTFLRRPVFMRTPYLIGDMADDVAGLCDALGITAAHVCGLSLGSSVAQHVAIRHPSRVLSLTVIHGTTADSKIPKPSKDITKILFQPAPTDDREKYADHLLNVFRVLKGKRFTFDEDWHRRLAYTWFDRGFSYGAGIRQAVATLFTKCWAAELSKLSVPTLVVQGTHDPMVAVEGGKSVAAAIPNARLLLIDGMGHELPHGGEPWPSIIEAISELKRTVPKASAICDRASNG